MKNTKQKILDTARELFNESGYSQVTIRMIALKLEMSSGNLNYHFRKREDILEALYFEMVKVFDERIENLGEQVISLEHMQTQIQNSMKRMVDYRFFWTDLYNLLKASNNIKTHFQSVRKHRIEGTQFVFNLLRSQNVLKPSSFPQEDQFLIERMIDYSNTWLYVSSLYAHKKKEAQLIERSSFNLLLMLYPYLTKQGKKEFESIHLGFFAESTKDR